MPGKRDKTVAVGLSGGVDSAVAAWLLKEQGYDLVGLTMEIWDGGPLSSEEPHHSGCYGPGEAQDIESARNICQRLEIKHQVIDLCDEYKREVLDYFRREYLAGRTPNPCVRCNRRMKFDALIEKARAVGVSFDYFATGHYVRKEIDPKTGLCRLKKARDQRKDQSYFLCQLGQEQLRHLLFPLGEMLKSEVKELAATIGWEDLAQKAESQDFMKSRDYGMLFSKEDLRPGAIVDSTGNKIGEHKGIAYYTIGQRRGVGSGAAEALYVTGIDAQHNTVKIGKKPDLLSRELSADQVIWSCVKPPDKLLRIKAKIRQTHREAEALLEILNEAAGSRVRILFDEAQSAITPGQVVAFYQDEAIIGGGLIVSSTHSDSR